MSMVHLHMHAIGVALAIVGVITLLMDANLLSIKFRAGMVLGGLVLIILALIIN